MDDPYGVVWLLLEDLGDVDLGFHFVAHFIRNRLKDVLKFEVILVDVSRYCPYELQTS